MPSLWITAFVSGHGARISGTTSFSMGLKTSFRPTALAELKIGQLTNETRDGEMVWLITEAAGSRAGASKTNPGGLAAVREKPPQIFVWNPVALDGTVNVYQDIEDYMQMRRSMDATTNRFFLGFNLKAETFSKYLKRTPLEKTLFSHRERRLRCVGTTGLERT